MKIGFDLDNVLIKTPPLVPGFVIEKLYKKKTKGTPVYRYPNKFEIVIRKLSHKKILRPPMMDNINFIRSIDNEKNNLYLISGRYSFLKPETERIIKEYGLNKIFKDCIFNYSDLQPHIFKNNVLKKLNLDYFLDDDSQLIKYIAKNNKKTQFFLLTTNNQKLTRNITAINNMNKMRI